jgi:ABC-type enterochelin transport system substrate-binding protein
MKRKTIFVVLVVMLCLFGTNGCSSQSATQTTAQPTVAQTQAAETTTVASQNEEKTIVTKEKVYDCDGSGHGYYHIVYSDGSTDDSEEF